MSFGGYMLCIALGWAFAALLTECLDCWKDRRQRRCMDRDSRELAELAEKAKRGRELNPHLY